jgi:NitT/TauT family transport system substrate-binding protein
VPDLKGKKIGVARGTSGDFFLGRFLEIQGMSIREVTVVDLPPAQVTDPLLNGTVDAVSTWDPYAYATEQRLGDNAQVWPDQKGRLMYWIAISREDYVTRNGTQVQKVLAALKQAEKFAVDHPGEAKAIVQKRLRTDDAYISRVWPNTALTLTLDQSLILAMEDEARWMIANNITSASAVPDFREYISTKSLEKIKPDAVRIIG